MAGHAVTNALELREELGHPSAHGMTAHHSALKPEMIEDGYRVSSEHVRAVFSGRFAGQARTAIIEDDDPVIPRKLRNLIDFPHGAVTGGFAEK